jgi:hypothetical protein
MEPYPITTILKLNFLFSLRIFNFWQNRYSNFLERQPPIGAGEKGDHADWYDTDRPKIFETHFQSETVCEVIIGKLFLLLTNSVSKIDRSIRSRI